MLNGTINITNLRSMIDINDIDYSEDIKDQLPDIITRDAKCNLERHRNEEQISSLPIIQEILFFTAEYKKRKFYLDCTVKKEGEVYIKNNSSYVQATPNDRSSAEMIISNRFLAKTDCVLYFGKDMGYERYNYKIYDFFKGEYEHSLNLIKDILHSPNKYGLDLLENEQNIFSSFKRYASNNDKCYERLLYNLGDHDFISKSRYASQHIVNIIREPFLQRITPRVVEILKNIVDIYGLYLSDLFQPTDVEDMVKNKQYKLSPIPYMFSINNLEDNIVDISPKKTSKTTIKFIINDRLNRCCTPAGLDDDNILSAVYAYEHTNQAKLNDSKYIECSENDKILEVTYNLEKQPSIPERCIGLYIWDKLHKKKTGDSISQIIRHLFFNA